VSAAIQKISCEAPLDALKAQNILANGEASGNKIQRGTYNNAKHH